jgi:acyl-CoA synthetase (AMP-forming)/AMP-acid ligase II
VDRFPERDAVVFPQLGVRHSWRALFLARIASCGRRGGLVALGIERGEHVAVWATNVPEWVVLQFATAKIGAVLVTINPAYRPVEMTPMHCGALAPTCRRTSTCNALHTPALRVARTTYANFWKLTDNSSFLNAGNLTAATRVIGYQCGARIADSRSTDSFPSTVELTISLPFFAVGPLAVRESITTSHDLNCDKLRTGNRFPGGSCLISIRIVRLFCWF